MFELIVKGEFSAAHHLRNYSGKCEKLHGHNYQVDLYISQRKLGDQGMLMDFTKLKAIMDEILGYLDHNYLNELDEFKKLNPTAENIAFIIHRKFKVRLPKSMGLKICVWESGRTGASYYNAM